MKTRIDASRLLVWRASWMGANGKEFTSGEGSMSKLYAGETAVYVTEEAIQILGGYGYVREYPVERWHRDSKIFTIFEGTSEIQRLIISPGHLGRPHQVAGPGPSLGMDQVVSQVPLETSGARTGADGAGTVVPGRRRARLRATG